MISKSINVLIIRSIAFSLWIMVNHFEFVFSMYMIENMASWLMKLKIEKICYTWQWLLVFELWSIVLNFFFWIHCWKTWLVGWWTLILKEWVYGFYILTISHIHCTAKTASSYGFFYSTKTEPPGFWWWTFVIISKKFTTSYSLIVLTVAFPTYLIFSLKIYKSQNFSPLGFDWVKSIPVKIC